MKIVLQFRCIEKDMTLVFYLYEFAEFLKLDSIIALCFIIIKGNWVFYSIKFIMDAKSPGCSLDKF